MNLVSLTDEVKALVKQWSGVGDVVMQSHVTEPDFARHGIHPLGRRSSAVALSEQRHRDRPEPLHLRQAQLEDLRFLGLHTLAARGFDTPAQVDRVPLMAAPTQPHGQLRKDVSAQPVALGVQVGDVLVMKTAYVCQPAKWAIASLLQFSVLSDE